MLNNKSNDDVIAKELKKDYLESPHSRSSSPSSCYISDEHRSPLPAPSGEADRLEFQLTQSLLNKSVNKEKTHDDMKSGVQAYKDFNRMNFVINGKSIDAQCINVMYDEHKQLISEEKHRDFAKTILIGMFQRDGTIIPDNLIVEELITYCNQGGYDGALYLQAFPTFIKHGLMLTSSKNAQDRKMVINYDNASRILIECHQLAVSVVNQENVWQEICKLDSILEFTLESQDDGIKYENRKAKFNISYKLDDSLLSDLTKHFRDTDNEVVEALEQNIDPNNNSFVADEIEREGTLTDDSFVHIYSIDKIIKILSNKEELEKLVQGGQDIQVANLNDNNIEILKGNLSDLDQDSQGKIEQLIEGIRKKEESLLTGLQFKDIAETLESLGGVVQGGIDTPKIAGFNQDDLLKIINFVKISYYVSDDGLRNQKFSELQQRFYKIPAELQGKDYKIFQFYNKYNDGMQDRHAGYVFIKDKEITIAYRGTRTSYDCMKDAQISLTASSAILPQGGKIHSGFYDLFRSSWGGLYKILKGHASNQKLEIKDFKINVTGHSMGGAIASIAALYLNKKHGARNLRVATFASPRVFDKNAAKFYEECLGDTTIRVSNRSDTVPSLPFGSMGYKHVGKELVLNGNSYLNSHQVDVYRNLIVNIEPENFKANSNVSRYYYFSFLTAAFYNAVTAVPSAAHQALVLGENDEQFFNNIENVHAIASLSKRIGHFGLGDKDKQNCMSYGAGDGFVGIRVNESAGICQAEENILMSTKERKETLAGASNSEEPQVLVEDIREHSPIRSDVSELSTPCVVKNDYKRKSSIKRLIRVVSTLKRQPNEQNHYAVLGFNGKDDFEKKLGNFVDPKIWELFKNHMTNGDNYKSHKQVTLQIVHTIIERSTKIKNKKENKILTKINEIKNTKDGQEDQNQSIEEIGNYLNKVRPEEVYNELERIKEEAEELFKKYHEKTQGEYNRGVGKSCTELYKETIDYIQSYEDLAKAKRAELAQEFLQKCKSEKKPKPEQEDAIKILADDELRKVYNQGLEEDELNQLASYDECRKLQNDLLENSTELSSHENTSPLLQFGNLDSHDVGGLPIAGETDRPTNLNENSRAYPLQDIEESLEESGAPEDNLALMGKCMGIQSSFSLFNNHNLFQRDIQWRPSGISLSMFSTSEPMPLMRSLFFPHVENQAAPLVYVDCKSLVSRSSRLLLEKSSVKPYISGQIGRATNVVNLSLVKVVGTYLIQQRRKGDSTEKSPMKVEFFLLPNYLVIGLTVADSIIIYASSIGVRAVFALANYITHRILSTVSNIGGYPPLSIEDTARGNSMVYSSTLVKNNFPTVEQLLHSFTQHSSNAAQQLEDRCFALYENSPSYSPIPAGGFHATLLAAAETVSTRANQKHDDIVALVEQQDASSEEQSTALVDDFGDNGSSVAIPLEVKKIPTPESPKGSEGSEPHVTPTVSSKGSKKRETRSTPKGNNSDGNTHNAMLQTSYQSSEESKFSAIRLVGPDKDDKQNKQGRKYPVVVGLTLLVSAVTTTPLVMHFVFATSLLATGIAAGACAIIALMTLHYCYMYCRKPVSAPASAVDGGVDINQSKQENTSTVAATR